MTHVLVMRDPVGIIKVASGFYHYNATDTSTTM